MTQELSPDTDQFRRDVDLSGTWRLRTDPADRGITDAWYDQDRWGDARTVDVPHAWQEEADLRRYTGTVWYRRRFSVDGGVLDDTRPFLAFGAVDLDATIWVNGQRVGRHRDGYLPFELEVSDVVQPGENVVDVRVEDPEDPSEVPHGKQGASWYTRVSGIWQNVSLDIRPSAFVSDVHVTPDLEDDTATVSAIVNAGDADPASFDGEVSIAPEGGEAVTTRRFSVDADGRASIVLPLEDPDYWSPDDPALYDVVVDLEDGDETIDAHTDHFGMRSVAVEDGQILLNGEPLYVRGALDQGYYPETFYRPFETGLFEREIRLAKELGFNLLRKHIKPAHPDFLEAADRLGLLVWEEPASPNVYTERSKRAVKDQIAGMLDRDYNRPSVIAWSLYNEEWGIGFQGDEEHLWSDEDKQAHLADLYAWARGRDPTRLVCDNSGWAHVATDLNDYHEYFVSPDRATAWEAAIDDIVANPADNYATTEYDDPDAPILISEFGTWGMPDIPALMARYGGEPHWFEHDFLQEFDWQGEKLKLPSGVAERFDDSQAADVFGDLSTLGEAWQGREYRSNKDIVETMRARESVAGYVVTEFTDVEWECNGLLDYFRGEKAFHDDFSTVNDDLLVALDLDAHAVRPGETVAADVVVSNHSTEPVDGSLSWSAFDSDGSIDVDLDGFGVVRGENAVDVTVPTVDEVCTEALTLSLSCVAGDATNAEPITVVPTSDMRQTGERAVYVEPAPLHDSIANVSAYDVVDDVDAADVAVVSTFDGAPAEFAASGGDVVLVPAADGHMVENEAFTYRNLPETESWHLVACLLYGSDDLVEDLTVDGVLGWAFEDLYPYEVVFDIDEADDIAVGYAEGWVANRAAAALDRPVGEGRVRVCTFRVTDAYGDHPTATLLLDRLLAG